MRCPHCGKEINTERIEEVLNAAEVAILFANRQVGYAELKAAVKKLEELRKKYPTEKEENDG